MIRGIYTSGSGMLAESLRTDVIANNLANASTTGYKKDVAVTKDFRSMLIMRINDGQDRVNIGSLGVGSMVDEVFTDQTPAGATPTGNALDLAIEGPGYFAVQTPSGIRYTRNGAFTRSSQGQLVTLEGYPVLGQGGAINLGTPGDTETITVSEDGRVLLDNIETDRVRLVSFADSRGLLKEGTNLYTTTQQEQPASGIIRQGALEHSNVNVVAEMVNMIAGYRAYETNAKAVQSHDQLLEKAATEVGRI